MKNFKKYFIALATLFSINYAYGIEETDPTKIAILFDYDKVVAKTKKTLPLLVALYGVEANPNKTYDYIVNGLLNVKKEYNEGKKASSGAEKFCIYNGKKISGLTFDWLYLGMKYPAILPHTAGLVKKIE